MLLNGLARDLQLRCLRVRSLQPSGEGAVGPQQDCMATAKAALHY